MSENIKTLSATASAAIPNLDERNYVGWEQKMEAALSSQCFLYSRILQGTMVKPVRRDAETDESWDSRWDKWDELQIQGRNTVLSKLGANALAYARSAGIVKNRPETDAAGRVTKPGSTVLDLKALWDGLQVKFQPKGVVTFQRLQTDLLSLSFDSGAQEFNDKFRLLDQELGYMSSTARLPATWLVAVYLQAMPSQYSAFKSRWISDNDYVDKIKAEEALIDLQEQTLQQEQLMLFESTKTTAFMAHGNQSNRGAKPGGARSSSTGSSSTGSSSTGKAEVKCTHCHRLYHTEAECVNKHPHLKAALYERAAKKREARKQQYIAKLKAEASASMPTPSAATPTAGLMAFNIKGAAGTSDLWDLGRIEED